MSISQLIAQYISAALIRLYRIRTNRLLALVQPKLGWTWSPQVLRYPGANFRQLVTEHVLFNTIPNPNGSINRPFFCYGLGQGYIDWYVTVTKKASNSATKSHLCRSMLKWRKHRCIQLGVFDRTLLLSVHRCVLLLLLSTKKEGGDRTRAREREKEQSSTTSLPTYSLNVLTIWEANKIEN